jgi:hypothetical protein
MKLSDIPNARCNLAPGVSGVVYRQAAWIVVTRDHTPSELLLERPIAHPVFGCIVAFESANTPMEVRCSLIDHLPVMEVLSCETWFFDGGAVLRSVLCSYEAVYQGDRP